MASNSLASLIELVYEEPNNDHADTAIKYPPININTPNTNFLS
ncbi:hypothetical protein VCHA37P200_50101 [Vibrio chagasii]|nr:hypothetical protein VCHA55O507_50238 [Vibrio chagasii]CAH7439925.1 hypothetical protein VCHA37P200_50101 [Vibrio chagasii]